ncbi:MULTISPECIES: phage tail tape measure protein [unclassified Kitasatospora]|uniref:phage tail tape measure protein n=1 Tax=unclassified Kitasatospora TaxID=2633591 RepID=UPI0033E6A1E4
MAVEVGMGYLSIVPEVEGFARELEQQVTGPAEQAGEAAGQQGGQAAGEGFTGKMGGVLKGSLLAVGLAAAAILVKGFSDALDQGAINGKIQASLGSTPEEAARYGKAAGQLYAHGVTENVEEAAQAISGVMRSGILPPDATNAQIESITGKVTDLSNTFELDLGQTSNAVGQMLKNGLAKDGTEALDILTKGMQQMGPRADDMADTMNEYSTKFRDLGLSAADAMGLMSQGMAAGARDTDVVADALKEFQIRATDGSKASTEAYEAIGLNAEAMTAKIAKGGPGAREGLQQVLDGLKGIKDPAERSAAAVGLFGTKAEDMGQALWALDPSTAVKALGDTAGAADKMGDALHNNAQAKIEGFKRSLEVGVSNFIGDNVIPVLERGGAVVASVFGPALDYGKQLASGFFGIFSGPGPSAVGSFGQTVVGLAGGVRDDLMPGLRGIVDVAQSTLLPALQGLGRVVAQELFPAMMTVYSAVASAVVPILSGLARILLETVWPAAMRIYAAFAENLQPIFSAVSDFMRDRVAPAAELIGGKLRELVDKAQPVISVVTSLISWLGRLAADILGAVIPVIIRFAGPIFSDLFGALGTAIGWVGNFIEWVGKIAVRIKDAGKAVVDFVKESAGKFGEFIDYIKGLPDRIKEAAGNFKDLLVEKGKDLARGIWDGISGMGGWLKDKLIGWAKSAIPGPIADALGIKSPSRVMAARVGRWIPAGIVEGVDQAEPDLTARLRALVTVPPVRVPAPVLALAGSAATSSAPSITVNARTEASPYEIGRELAWQLRVGGA